MVLDWKFWPVLGGLAAIAVAAFAVPASPAYYDSDSAMIGEYVPVIHSGNGVCITEYAGDGLTKKIMDCSAEVGEVVLIQYEPGQGSAVFIDGIAYPATGSDMPVNLVVTTHNPACTAIFMHGRDGVALQTELRPDPITQNSYTAGEIQAGINLTYATTARLVGELVPALAERQVVSSVVSYSVSDPPALLANATSSVIDKRCADNEMPDHLFREIYDIVLQSSKAPGASASSRSSGGSGDSGTPASGQMMMWIAITTIGGNAEVLALLEEHGIPAHIVDEPRLDSKYHGSIMTNVPVSLLIPLTQLDSVVDVDDMNQYTLQIP